MPFRRDYLRTRKLHGTLGGNRLSTFPGLVDDEDENGAQEVEVEHEAWPRSRALTTSSTGLSMQMLSIQGDNTGITIDIVHYHKHPPPSTTPLVHPRLR